MDEKKGITGVDRIELADWWPSVKKQFCSAIPKLETVAVVKEVEGKTLIGLNFITDKAPYLVKNPQAGPVDREVPWREGNDTRSAYRDDLIRILIPRSYKPDIEWLSASVDLRYNQRQKDVTIECRLYLYASIDSRLTLPYHRCKYILRSSSADLAYEVPVKAERSRIRAIAQDTDGSLIRQTMNDAT